MILFFKNNWNKIVDLVTKVFNTLSAVAENNTKIVADGIEFTMARGIQVIFNFFMTNLGLGGIVNSVIGIFKKIGAFLRKTITKAVSGVVNWVKEKFGNLFGKGKKAGEVEEEEQGENKIGKLANVKSTFKENHGLGPMHTIKFVGSGKKFDLRVFSPGREVKAFLNDLSIVNFPADDSKKKALKEEGIAIEERITNRIKDQIVLQKDLNEIIKDINRLHFIMATLTDKFPELPIPEYDFDIDSDGKAKRARVDRVSSRTGIGTTPGSAWVKGWEHLQKDLTTGGGKWKRLHMLNEKRFGGLDFSANLVPGPNQANQNHKNKWGIPADKALGPSTTTYDSSKHKVAWLEARISYYSGNQFEPKYDPPTVKGELPMKHWYAKQIDFTSGRYDSDGKGNWKKTNKKLVPDFALTTNDLPLPDWSLAKIPPINTGDRSEFQMKAVKHALLTPKEAKAIFNANGTWKYLAKRRKEKSFSTEDDVLDFLYSIAETKNPENVQRFITVIELLFKAKSIRING